MADITKINLNGTSYTIVDSAATSAIATETARAQAAESANTQAIAAEVVARQSADTALQTAIDAKADSATTYTKTEVDNKFTSAATATTQQIAQAVSGKQDTLTAGTGIDITNNVISCTVDTGLYVVVQTLPAQPAAGNENKIHLVPLPASATGQNDQYEEYLWKGTEWEYLGVRQADIDLSDYYTSGQVDTLLAAKVDNSTYSAYTAATATLISSAQSTADSAVTAINSHTANTNNPHQVTASQLGISASYDAQTETLVLNIPGASSPVPSDNFYIVSGNGSSANVTGTNTNGVWTFNFSLPTDIVWALYNNGTVVTASSINIDLVLNGEVDDSQSLEESNYAVEDIAVGSGIEDDNDSKEVSVTLTASTLTVSGSVYVNSPTTDDPCEGYGSQEECDCVTQGGVWNGSECETTEPGE